MCIPIRNGVIHMLSGVLKPIVDLVAALGL